MSVKSFGHLLVRHRGEGQNPEVHVLEHLLPNQLVLFQYVCDYIRDSVGLLI